MKKVGLAVCYDTKNFGSQLQVLATIKKVEELGYKTEIIRYKKKLTPTFVLQTIPRLFNVSFTKQRYIQKIKASKLKNIQILRRMSQIRNNRFNEFVKSILQIFLNRILDGKIL